MAKHKYNKLLSRLLREIVKLSQTLTRQTLRWLWRSFFVANRRRQNQAGFVLPTVAMMLMVVALVVGAIMFRTFTRTNQVISNQQQTAINNAATPAIERAKSKLEYLFNIEKNLPPGIPSEDGLETLLLKDSYVFPDEQKENNLVSGVQTPAWRFETKINNQDFVTIYTIMAISARNGVDIADSATNYSDKDKANAFVVRNGPLASQGSGSTSPKCPVPVGGTTGGWFKEDETYVAKNFQVYAVTVPKSVYENKTTANPGIATLQYQQDRRFERGNKWGAWFRSDMEFSAGPLFRWNGAMHSQGNMFLRSGSTLSSYLLSADASCFFKPESNSAITTAGQFASGQFRDNNFNSTNVYIQTYDTGKYGNSDTAGIKLIKEIDSVIEGGKKVSDVAIDPLELIVNGQIKSRTDSGSSSWQSDSKWTDGDMSKRVEVQTPKCAPYVDDTYRADDRYGPKPAYTKETFENNQCQAKLINKPIGDDIPSSEQGLIKNEPPSADRDEDVGLDGYWERRARYNGLRLIVGQRLELGNTFGWNDTTEALYPPRATDSPTWASPPNTDRRNEVRQYRTLRDNLAAVQATAVYHHTSDSGYFPIAYVATTVHPGTLNTLNDSATVRKPATPFDISTGTIFTGTKFGDDDDERLIDFFTGQGTNGWEFETKYTPTSFASAIGKTQPLGIALRNLANFAGDRDGAFPPKQETSGSNVHPYPTLTMWGNFSNLRDTLRRLDTSTSYANLSIADQSNLHTAAGTLGMLAYNISYLQAYSSSGDKDKLNTALGGVAPDAGFEAAIKHLRTASLSTLGSDITTEADRQKLIQLAYVIHLKHQIDRDRDKGFAPGTVTCDVAKICPSGPKFPSLYYIFPKADRSHASGGASEYVSDTYIGTTVNGAPNLYKALTDANISSIALKPRKLSDWKLPKDNSLGATSCDTSAKLHFDGKLNFIKDEGASNPCVRVAFKDSALFDGREMMSVRALSMDLDLLRRTKADSGDTDKWLPKSGLVYAFREDAVREDAIARPQLSNWTTYYNQKWHPSADPSSTEDIMQVWPLNPQDPPKDPPVSGDLKISPKPVDYYADPDRRVHGFRVKNGRDLTRVGWDLDDSQDRNNRGLSFISDNPVYLQGDFNWHRNKNDTAALEEFQTFLQDDYKNFYSRDKLDENFARPGTDRWRPSEIIADAVTILSNNFCDGTVASGIADTNEPALSGCASNTVVPSYRNGHMWAVNTAPAQTWVCENTSDVQPTIPPLNTGKSCYGPIKVLRDGSVQTNPVVAMTYRNFPDRRPLNIAADTRVNAIIVSGIVPPRKFQNNGGLSNFPRFIESWNTSPLTVNYPPAANDLQSPGANTAVPLRFSGSLVQLNFSNYATGPWDQDAWHPGQMPTSGGPPNENLRYYNPPDRRWGYDVGLQYAPAGPVARRMVVPDLQRSEFYREPPADDPYICLLRKAVNYPCPQ